jgi:hypothetical protein
MLGRLGNLGYVGLWNFMYRFIQPVRVSAKIAFNALREDLHMYSYVAKISE